MALNSAPPSRTAPLLSDGNVVIPKRANGYALAVAMATAIAALPSVLLASAYRWIMNGNFKLATGAGIFALLALIQLGRWPVQALPTKWHGGLSLKTNLYLCVLLNFSSGFPDLAAQQLSTDEIVSTRDEFRKTARRLYARLVPSNVKIEEVHVPSDQAPPALGSLPPFARHSPHLQFRIYRPPANGQDPLPCLVFAHGGAFVVGGTDTHEHITSRLAAWANCVVVSVEYRMFPEIEANETCRSACDLFAVLRHCTAHASELNIDPACLAIGGDSAGGNLAATCALLARDAGIPLMFQLLVYPVVAVSRGPLISASAIRNADAPLINLRSISELSLLANKGALLSPDYADFEAHGLSPLCAQAGLAGSPRAIILSAYYDPLFDHAEEYARALRAVGVDVYYKCYYVMHGFWGGVTSDEGEASLRETARLMEELFVGSNDVRENAPTSSKTKSV